MSSTYKSYKYQDPFKNNTPGETAQKMAAAAKGKPQPKAQPKKNPFSGLSNAQIKAKYKGMSQADKKKFGMQMHTAAMANRKKGGAKAVSTTAQPSAKPKAAGNKPVQKQTKVQKAVAATKPKASDKAVEGGYTISSKNRKPKDKKKSKLNPQQKRKLGITKKRGGTSPAKLAKSISEKLRLTYKKGELVKRGNKVYRSDGKGKLTLVHRKQF